jgi:hypothetical protein
MSAIQPLTKLDENDGGPLLKNQLLCILDTLLADVCCPKQENLDSFWRYQLSREL